MEHRICVISDADWNAISSGDKISVGVHETERRYYRSNEADGVKMHRAELDGEDLYLVEYSAFADSHGGIEERDSRDIAIFHGDDASLELLDGFEEIKENTSGSNIMALPYFVRHICMHHNDEIAGKNVFAMMRKQQLLTVIGCVNLMKYYDHVVSIEKLGTSFIQSINSEEFSINTEARDRHRTLNLPKQVLAYIEAEAAAAANNYWRRNVSTELLTAFQKIMTGDANEVIEIINILHQFEKVGKKIPNKASGNYGSAASPGDPHELIKHLAEIKTIRPDMDCRKVINYLIKQQFLQLYEVGYSNASFDPIRFSVTVPSRLAGIFEDYLKMNPTELFPQDLYKSHNVLAIEAKINISEEDAKKFRNYGTSLASFYNMEVKNYRFEVPTDYAKFVEIGKTFMNCLPTCGKAFYSGLCDIVFIYGNGDEIPKYAIELNSRAQVMQAKTTRDLDIEDESVLQAIESYVDEIAKKQKM